MNHEQTDPETFDIMKMGRRVQSRMRNKRVARVAAGAALLGFGVAKGRLLGLSLAGLGLHLVYEAVTGHSLLDELRARTSPRRLADNTRSRAFRRDRLDQVDLASWESFPASDPPGYHSGGV